MPAAKRMPDWLRCQLETCEMHLAWKLEEIGLLHFQPD